LLSKGLLLVQQPLDPIFSLFDIFTCMFSSMWGQNVASRNLRRESNGGIAVLVYAGSAMRFIFPVRSDKFTLFCLEVLPEFSISWL
jgi:hypothetical protein